MEKTSYWMWSKRKYNPISHLQPPTNTNSYRDSWEEQAFAVDAAGLIGGCIWPPCSYSCSFCRREFRSAQALGGHMNVHRRDRARLNQSPYPHNDEILHKHHGHQDHIPNANTSLDCNHNHSKTDRVVFPAPSSASRVFSPTRLAQENCDERIFRPTISPPNSIDNLDHIQLTPSSLSNFVTDMYFHAADPNNTEEIMKSTPKLVVPKGGANKEDHVKADLSIINPNLVFCQIRQAGDGEEEDGLSCKRRRTNDSNSGGGNSTKPLQSEELELRRRREKEEEEVDLELRLGYHPEVM